MLRHLCLSSPTAPSRAFVRRDKRAQQAQGSDVISFRRGQAHRSCGLSELPLLHVPASADSWCPDPAVVIWHARSTRAIRCTGMGQSQLSGPIARRQAAAINKATDASKLHVDLKASLEVCRNWKLDHPMAQRMAVAVGPPRADWQSRSLCYRGRGEYVCNVVI